MRLNRLSVKGELKCEYEFGDINVLLGDNNSGKSTLIKLILFCLGAPIKSFIEEISKENKCESVTLEVTFRNGKKKRIIRKLPNSEAFLVTPIKRENEIVNDEIEVFNAAEFSDFLLENEGYSAEKIVYAKDKTASFRFYFLLRALYVDQDTSAQSVLSDLDMGHDYFTAQPIIKKTIIEKLLGKDNSELQRIRANIQELNKQHNDLSSQIFFLNEQKNRMDEQYDINPKKIDAELVKIREEKDVLAQARVEQMCKVQYINDSQDSQMLVLKQKMLKEKIQNDQILKLEISDLEEIIKSLSADAVALNYKIAARDILEELPILYCPNCLSELSEDVVKNGLCDNCHKKTQEEKILNNATLKKTINDSIVEAQELLQIKRNLLLSNKQELQNLEKEIREEKERLFSEKELDRNVLKEAIESIKQRLEYLISQENILTQYRKGVNDLSELKIKRKEVLAALNDNKETLLKADIKATNAMENFESFKIKFSEYLNVLFSEIGKIGLDENYMPVIDDNKITNVSSASLKVAIRLAYILSLMTSSNLKENSHIGILLLDSPKDKDLDDYRFAEYLSLINSECNGQILITGSISDKEIYKERLVRGKFFDELTTESKLLK